jgi:hypothetical protein
MARAFIGAVECRVTVDKDLGDSWAVAVIPSGVAAPLVVKLQGNDKAAVTKGRAGDPEAGKIDRFEVSRRLARAS